MKTSDLLLSSLNITEDDYDYKGLFILSSNNVSINVDIADLENNNKVEELKCVFGLEEPVEEIREVLMNMIMEKAAISSKICEGENYEEKSQREYIEKAAYSLNNI